MCVCAHDIKMNANISGCILFNHKRKPSRVCVCVCVCVCLCMCVCLREIIVCGCAMLNHKRTHRKQQVPSNQSYLICIKRTHRHERYQHTSQPLSTPSSLSISICINSFDIPHARLVVFELLVALEALVTSNTVEHSRLLFFLLFTLLLCARD